MRRAPVRGSIKDSWLILCSVRAQLDEMLSESSSYATSCMYALRRATRFGDEYDIPVMVAHGPEELVRMNKQFGAVGHEQIRWWLADRTRSVGWDTSKKERSALFNYYRAMGWDLDHIPTSTPNFTSFMNGMLQRKGASTTQCAIFRDVLIEDMCALIRGEFKRARGAQKLHLARVQLAWHAYMQTGARANELFEQKLGPMVDSFCFGEEARRNLALFGSNSFRRSWTTLASSHRGGGVVDEHLRDRQGRWRTKSRTRCLGKMVNVYNDAQPEDLLLATYDRIRLLGSCGTRAQALDALRHHSGVC